ncbi:hypothetical protein [Pseudoalteromonas marina]|nr:hypothetical protein [Pseudoalteromonas marina]MDP2487231.1 hypothetical protein [Pseudoalteromonas marina]
MRKPKPMGLGYFLLETHVAFFVGALLAGGFNLHIVSLTIFA